MLKSDKFLVTILGRGLEQIFEKVFVRVFKHIHQTPYRKIIVFDAVIKITTNNNLCMNYIRDIINHIADKHQIAIFPIVYIQNSDSNRLRLLPIQDLTGIESL
jgi:hypothetical protein